MFAYVFVPILVVLTFSRNYNYSCFQISLKCNECIHFKGFLSFFSEIFFSLQWTQSSSGLIKQLQEKKSVCLHDDDVDVDGWWWVCIQLTKPGCTRQYNNDTCIDKFSYECICIRMYECVSEWTYEYRCCGFVCCRFCHSYETSQRIFVLDAIEDFYTLTHTHTFIIMRLRGHSGRQSQRQHFGRK